MRVYYVEHDGVWMAGYSVVVARDRGHAKRLLTKLLKDNDLEVDGHLEITEVNIEEAGAHLVWNGDY